MEAGRSYPGSGNLSWTSVKLPDIHLRIEVGSVDETIKAVTKWKFVV